MTNLYQITTNYFCCGVEVSDDSLGYPVVTKAAPIMKWAVGKRWPEVRLWVHGKHGEIVLIDHNA